MLKIKTLILGHHGTPGAASAEQLAFELAEPGTRIVHLLVVPDFWAGMQGDDWLNNASTRDAFAEHVEKMLEREAADQVRALGERCAERGLDYVSVVRFGDPAECMIQVARETGAELAVLGPRRKKGEAGYRSRMDLEKLTADLGIPFVVAARAQ